MAFRKKGFSAKQGRRMSQRMEDAQVGSHVRRSGQYGRSGDAGRGAYLSRSGRAGTGADSVRFSSSRGQARARQGSIGAFTPASAESTSRTAYRSRQQQRYMQEVARRSRRRRILLVVLVLLAIAAAAVFVGRAAYLGSVGSHMALRGSDAEDALVEPAANAEGPYYALVSVELGAVAQPLDNGGPDSLLLVRVDEQAGTLAVANIPGELQVAFTDGQMHSISEAAAQGDAALIRAVAKFAGVDIAHFAKLDEAGVAGLVDGLGGITVDVAAEIDDPHAGSAYLPAGVQTLTGAQALVYLRADNLAMGAQDRMENQAAFAAAVLAALFSTDGGSFAGKLDSVNSCFQTDYSSRALVSLAGKLDQGLLHSMPHSGIPGYSDADLGVVEGSGPARRWVTAGSDMQAFMDSFATGHGAIVQGSVDGVSSGDGAVAGAEGGTGIARGSFTIEVQNGSQIEGAAGSTAERLSQMGFNVVEVGNAEQPVYEETLLVWQGENGRAKAQMVLDAMGWGRIVDSSEYYEFETDVLVILGSDFHPTA